MAVGMDIGTAFLVSARQDSNNQSQIRSIRDAFLDLDNLPEVKSMLKLNSDTDFIEAGDKLYIVGDPALVLANIFTREARRPLSQGVISPGELEAEKVLAVLLDSVIGKAANKGETCFFSVPAASIDKEMDVIYHSAMFSKLISDMGYEAHALNEAAAIVYSNAAKEKFSALSISCGAGMVNVCLMYQTMIGMEFSLSRAGDWIDQSAARACGTTASRITSIKEKGVDLMNIEQGDAKTSREREAIQVYYKSLVMYALDTIRNEFMKRQGTINLPDAVPIILSGGTAKAKNFKEFFETAFNEKKDTFPIPVSEIRLANDPLNAVAQGLLVAAMNYDEGIGKNKPQPQPKEQSQPEQQQNQQSQPAQQQDQQAPQPNAGQSFVK